MQTLGMSSLGYCYEEGTCEPNKIPEEMSEIIEAYRV